MWQSKYTRAASNLDIICGWRFIGWSVHACPLAAIHPYGLRTLRAARLDACANRASLTWPHSPPHMVCARSVVALALIYAPHDFLDVVDLLRRGVRQYLAPILCDENVVLDAYANATQPARGVSVRRCTPV